MFHSASARRGFTLLELSIVLVIIALIAGGIFAGTSMIRTSELRSIHIEADEYRSAISAFQDQYLNLPGDMPNATDLWDWADCPDVGGEGTETCNGNGNRKIAAIDTDFTNDGESEESFFAWKHLQNAGITDTSLTGVPGDSERDAVINSNIPRSAFDKGAGWSLFNLPYTNESSGNCRTVTASGGYSQNFCHFASGDTQWIFTGRRYDNVLALGAEYADNYALKPILTPNDADALDDKFDDGLPGTGRITAVGDYSGDSNSVPDCFGPVDPHNAGYTTQIDYSLDQPEVACALIFTLQ